MSPEQKRLIFDLANGRITRVAFLHDFPFVGDGSELAIKLLEACIDQRDVEGVELALAVGFVFGFSPAHAAILKGLVLAGWHHSHEDVVFALDQLRDGAAVDVLYEATQIVPDYLAFDENRA